MDCPVHEQDRHLMGCAFVKRMHHVPFTSCVRHAKDTFLPSIIFFLYGTTSKYLTMDITDTSDDDESVSGLSLNSDVSLIEDIWLASLALSFRENKLLVARMNWHHHVQSLLHENLFHVKYWMSLSAFDKLLTGFTFPHAEVECYVCQNGRIQTHFHRNHAPLYYSIFSRRFIP
jgi:hypothetical protein